MSPFGKGKVFPPEKRTFTDDRTGAVVTQLTHFPAVHHAPYFTNPALTPDGVWLLFVSCRSGKPNLFCVNVDSGDIRQLTDRDDLNPWSALVADRERALFTAGEAVWAVSLTAAEEDVVARFTGARLSNLNLNHDGSLVVTNVRRNGRNAITAVKVDGSGARTVLETERAVGHIQFAPSPDNAICYSGDAFHRLWCVNFDGTDDRWIYPQSPSEWLTHETWLNADDILFVHWKRALRAVHRSGSVRTIAEFQAWHPSVRRSDALIVTDTALPDIGLQLVHPRTGARTTLCYPESSNLGWQWRESIHAEAPEYRDRPAPPELPGEPRREGVYGPQWTHPHPSWSPDGQKVVFTSDRSGWSQVYVVELSKE